MKNKKVIIAIISVVALLLVLIGVTYAYWLVTKTQTNNNIISSACLDITLEKESDAINLGSQYPMSDAEGMKLTPYTFIVTNNCNTSIDYRVALESIGDEANAIKTSALKVALDTKAELLSNKAKTSTTVSGAYASHKLGYGTLAARGSEGSSVRHELRIWIDENAPISESNKTYQSKISVTIGQGISNPIKEGTMAYDILQKNILVATEPDFSIISSEVNENVYKTIDDLGDSYYFRGNPTNNYVQFGETSDFYYYEIPEEFCYVDSCSYLTLELCEAAEARDYITYGQADCTLKTVVGGSSMYWRIVRINGDGTIRLVYDGTTKVENGIAHSATIGNTTYNGEDYLNVNYGDSDIKGVVDTWYNTHLKTNYETSIADGIFCNDKEVTNTTYYDEYGNTEDENGNPITKENATHATEYYASLSNKTPQLTCTREEDRYTTSTSLGNGQLTHPVGLLTADEAFFAGGAQYSNSNTSYYLYSGESFWTLSPSYNGGIGPGSGAHVWLVNSEGQLTENNVYGDGMGQYYLYAIRPVINLRTDVEFTGDGSFENPYVIKTN